MTDPGPLPNSALPRRTQIHVWLDDDLAEWLRIAAFHARCPRTEVVARVLRQAAAAAPAEPPMLVSL